MLYKSLLAPKRSSGDAGSRGHLSRQRGQDCIQVLGHPASLSPTRGTTKNKLLLSPQEEIEASCHHHFLLPSICKSHQLPASLLGLKVRSNQHLHPAFSGKERQETTVTTLREYATPADRWARALSKLVLDFPGLPIDHALPKRDLKYRLSWVRGLYLVRPQDVYTAPRKVLRWKSSKICVE